MTVHLDRTHHHPQVRKRFGYWQAKCDRCGLLHIEDPQLYTVVSKSWRLAFVAALTHSRNFT